MDIFLILSQPFMIRALVAGLVVASLCGIIGVFLTLRNKSFMSDGIAHGSLTGVAIGIAIGVEPVFTALLIAVFMAIGITYVRKNSRLSQDAVIGIFFSLMFAIGVVVLNLTPGFQAELGTYLFGKILSVNIADITFAGLVLTATLVIVYLRYTQLVYSTFDPEGAYIRGIKVEAIEYMINILIALTIVVSIKLVGIILVSALLITPASTAKLMSKSFKQMIPASVLQNILAVIVGLFIAAIIDVSPGPIIVVVSSLWFFVIFSYQKLTHQNV